MAIPKIGLLIFMGAISIYCFTKAAKEDAESKGSIKTLVWMALGVFSCAVIIGILVSEYLAQF